MSEAPPRAAGSTAYSAGDRKTLSSITVPFATPDLRAGLWQSVSTFLLFVVVTTAAYAALDVSVWLSLALTVPAAGLTVRLFIIQHDCGHGSFFRSRRANDLLGRFLGIVTFTPYAFWRRQHAKHHACFNNLDRRDTGIDIYSTCATVREFEALSPVQRFLYRLSRHPIVTQLILPPVVFMVLYRLPFDTPRSWTRERRSVHLTNLAIGSVLAVLMLLLGVWPVLLVQVATLSLAAVVGVWIFSVQHRFEEALWTREEEWDRSRAALEGSSYFRLPPILQWFTGNIGYHHVHHLAVRVPNYHLQACHDASPFLSAGVTTLTIREALRAPTFALWDEEAGRMVRLPSIRWRSGRASRPAHTKP